MAHLSSGNLPSLSKQTRAAPHPNCMHWRIMQVPCLPPPSPLLTLRKHCSCSLQPEGELPVAGSPEHPIIPQGKQSLFLENQEGSLHLSHTWQISRVNPCFALCSGSLLEVLGRCSEIKLGSATSKQALDPGTSSLALNPLLLYPLIFYQ